LVSKIKREKHDKRHVVTKQKKNQMRNLAVLFVCALIFASCEAGPKQHFKNKLHLPQILSRDQNPPEAPFSFSWDNCGKLI
jgi:hypothetical protein